jgi:c-di-AMP phosphodiesterase-like protein
MGHRSSDLDSVGSSVGMCAAARSCGKPAYVVLNRENTLAGDLVDKIKSYDKMEKREPTFISPAKAKENYAENSLLIITDVHSPHLLDDEELYNMAKKVVVIDHHRKMVDHITKQVIFYLETAASSASEMVSEILQYFGETNVINAMQADALLAGIMLDTKNFTIKTGVRTFEAAAFLRKEGADTINVKWLFNNSFEGYKMRLRLIAMAEIHKKCAITGSDELAEIMKTVAPQTADEMLGVKGVDASFVVYRTKENEVAVSARSFGVVNVQLIMEAMGGGGHQIMAGVQIQNKSVLEVKAMLLEVLDRLL